MEGLRSGRPLFAESDRANTVVARELLCARPGYTPRSLTGRCARTHAHAPSLSLSPSPLFVLTVKGLQAAVRHITLRENAALTICSFSVSKKSA